MHRTPSPQGRPGWRLSSASPGHCKPCVPGCSSAAGFCSNSLREKHLQLKNNQKKKNQNPFLPLAVRKTENKSWAYPVGSKTQPSATYHFRRSGLVSKSVACFGRLACDFQALKSRNILFLDCVL